MSIKIILCTDKEGNMGYNNDLLYFFKKDLKRFKELTKGCTVVCGRNTWDSLPFKLKNRKNLVLTSSIYMRGKTYLPEEKKPDGFLNSIDDILELGKKEDIWIIGGAQLYSEMFQYADVVEHIVIDDVCLQSDVGIPNINREILKHFKSMTSEIIRDTDKNTGNEYLIDFRTFNK